MAITFKEEGHLYESIDEDKINWLSVTSFIAKFKPKFDRDAQATKSSKNKKSKWYKMSVNEIIASWEGESQRAIKLGNFYHNQRESDMIELNTIGRNGIEIPIIKPIVNDKGVKFAPIQKLKDGILFSGEIVRIRKDGSLIYLQATYNPIIGVDDKIYSIMKIATDVTNSHEQKKEIERFKRLLKSITMH